MFDTGPLNVAKISRDWLGRCSMKYALIIPDGCADEPQAVLEGQTPLEVAAIPHMDAVVRDGRIGRAETVPASLPAGSDVGTMSLFGYDPLEYHTGRAPLEAAAQGIELGPHDWAIRCNLVTIEGGRMVSFTAGQIPNEAADNLLERLRADQKDDSPWEFHTGVSYRNLLIYRGEGRPELFDGTTTTVPPHDILDQPVAPVLPSGPGSIELRALTDRSVALFAEAEANRMRRQQGDRPATGIWLWGLGRRPRMQPFLERFGVSAAVVTAVDLLRGLGTILGWRVVDVPGATGYTDTDYTAKGRYAIKALNDVDLVVVHVEATDEASHEGDAAEKVRALERIDTEIVGPLHEFLRAQGEYRILVSPDHPTLLRTRTHSHGEVPFAICGTGITADETTQYSESTAATSNLVLAGHELMPMLLESI